MKTLVRATIAVVRAGFWEGVYSATQNPEHGCKAYVAAAQAQPYLR